jgi:hypothetical protein
MGLQEFRKGMDWIYRSKDMESLRAVVNMVMNF